jgi:hypothetical protein
MENHIESIIKRYSKDKAFLVPILQDIYLFSGNVL